MPAANLLGGIEGHGMQHVLNGLEVGRINIASRAVGVARAAFECAIRYSQQRYTFGKPIASTRRSNSSSPTWPPGSKRPACSCARRRHKKDSGQRCDLEAGMAKLFASETCGWVTLGRCAYSAAMATPRSSRRAPPRAADDHW